MKVLVVNAGSSSLKLQLLADGVSLADRTIERWVTDGDLSGLVDFLGSIEQLDAVGHRVVHGGPRYSRSTMIDDGLVDYLESIIDLAPLHQPKAIAAIRALRELLPDKPQVACFDTAFHSTIPAAAATYAVPAEWNARWQLRRYGFHGLSHSYASRRCAKLVGRNVEDLRIVTCHLGAGASLCAIVGGISVDTTMGFTPLEGLVMVTRSGSVDPGMLLWLLANERLSLAELSAGLQFQGGLAGLSGTSGDVRDVVTAADSGSDAARLALDVFGHRLATDIGRMIVSAGGIDALVFTGGIGEHQPLVRDQVAERLAFMGVAVDSQLNHQVGPGAQSDGLVSTANSAVAIAVVRAREDLAIADEVATLLTCA